MNTALAIKPYDMHQGRQRRLTMILTGVFSLIMVSLTLISFIGAVANTTVHPLMLLELTTSIIFIGLYLTARHHHIISAHLLLILLCSLYLHLILMFGVSLTTAEVLAAATVTMAGVMLQARYVLAYCGILAAIVTIVSFLQSSHILHPDLSWRLSMPIGSDAIGIAALFIFIGVVTWVSAREIDHLLALSKTSEQALLKEKNLLELRVKQRTKALERAHVERTIQNQRFIQCGQLYANLIHDLLNPLTSVNLQLGRIEPISDTDALQKAQAGLKHIERYITGARKQLNGQSRQSTFSINRGVRDAVGLIKHISDHKEVSVIVNPSLSSLYITGDPVRFSQVIINLVLNAIQSYSLDTPHKPVVISWSSKDTIILKVTDNGRGMTTDEVSQLFEPFRSNRADGSTGLGIGLYLVKQYVEEDLGGSISINSHSKGQTGTTVTLIIPSARNPK